MNMAAGIPGLMTANSLLSEDGSSNSNSSNLNNRNTYMESFRVAAFSTRSKEGEPEEKMEHVASWVAKAS